MDGWVLFMPPMLRIIRKSLDQFVHGILLGVVAFEGAGKQLLEPFLFISGRFMFGGAFKRGGALRHNACVVPAPQRRLCSDQPLEGDFQIRI